MKNNNNDNRINPIINDKRIKDKAIQNENGDFIVLQDGRAKWGERKNYCVNFAKVFYALGSEELKNAENSGTLKIDKLTGEVFNTPEARKYFLKHMRMSECSLRLDYKIKSDNSVNLFNVRSCRDRFCPICMWRLSRRVAWETQQIIEQYMAENSDMIPIMIGLTVRNPSKGELSKMLDVLCNGDSGAWQLLRKWLARRGLKDFIRTVEVTYNYKKSSWHPHIHALFFVPKEYFSKDNKNYISQEQLVEYWKHACKLDYKPVVDIRRVYDKNKPKERIKLDTDIKAMDLSGAIFETAKYCVKPLNLFSNTLDSYDNTDELDELKVTINIKEVVRELSNALHGRRLRALGGKLKKIAKRLKFVDDDNKKDLIHNGEDFTAEAVWEEIYEYVFEDKEYYLTARKEVEQPKCAEFAADVSNFPTVGILKNLGTPLSPSCTAENQLVLTDENKLKNACVYSEHLHLENFVYSENFQSEWSRGIAPVSAKADNFARRRSLPPQRASSTF